MIIVNGVQNIVDGKQVAELTCDNATDVSNLPTYATRNNLAMGSTCLCIATSDVYAMKSDGTWVVL